MKLTIIGNNGGYPRAGGVGMGMLLQSGEANILLECGAGVVSKLQQFVQLYRIDIIIISHLHADHYSDLGVFRYATQMHLRDSLRSEKPKLYLPEGCIEKLDILFQGISDNFEIITISETRQFREGNLILSFMKVPHSKTKKCYATKIEADSKKIVYSGDTGYFDKLKLFAANADLFICEAGVEEKFKEFAQGRHLTPKQAAEIAKQANVKQLLLTHIYPLTSYETIRGEAKEIITNVEVALEGETYKI